MKHQEIFEAANNKQLEQLHAKAFELCQLIEEATGHTCAQLACESELYYNTMAFYIEAFDTIRTREFNNK